MNTRFELKNICKYYYKKTAITRMGGKPKLVPILKKLNYSIYDNKINALMGRSGCGKSTLARILMGMESFEGGKIIYKSKECIHCLNSTEKKKIQKKRLWEFRKKNQIMFQNPFLSVNPRFNIRKILAEPLQINTRDSGHRIAEKINRVLDILNIPSTFLDRHPKELSGGQLQRIVLGRALILEPEFLVLDEPFSSLDDMNAGRLMDFFLDLFHKMEIGILFISHHPHRVRYFAHHVALMEGGRIIKQADTASFFS